MINSLETLLEDGEGRSVIPYRCTSGKLTFGKGWNYEDRGLPLDVITYVLKALSLPESIAVCEMLFNEGKKEALRVARLHFGRRALEELNEPRRAVIIDMAYNMSPKSFAAYNVKTFPLIRAGRYEEAAAALLSNKKYVAQVKRRAYRNAEILKTGEWPK